MGSEVFAPTFSRAGQLVEARPNVGPYQAPIFALIVFGLDIDSLAEGSSEAQSGDLLPKIALRLRLGD